MISTKRALAAQLSLAITLVVLPSRAYSSDFITGVNIVNPMQSSLAEQDNVIKQLKANNVHFVRCGIGNKDSLERGELTQSDKGIDFAKRLDRKGIKIELCLSHLYSPNAPTRPFNPEYPTVYSGHPLSYADPERSKIYFKSLFDKLDTNGIVLAGLELSNEINWACFNAEFPVPGEGMNFGLDGLHNDPEGQQIAKGLRQYIKILAALKDVRDHSKLNQQTPIISAGLADDGPEGPWKRSKIDGVSLNAALRFMRENGLDSFVDAYGIHHYPSAKTAEERKKRLNNACSQGRTAKPCWITEWGVANDDMSCPLDDSKRAVVVQEILDDLRELKDQGRLVGAMYFSWNSSPGSKKVEPKSLFRCGALTKSGNLVLAAGNLSGGIAQASSANAASRNSPTKVTFKQSYVRGDSRTKNGTWNEFYHSPKDLLKSNCAYRISFNYKVIARNSDANFYALVRDGSALKTTDIGKKKWYQGAGSTGMIEINVPASLTSDSYLIIGIQNKGAIEINNLRIESLIKNDNQ